MPLRLNAAKLEDTRIRAGLSRAELAVAAGLDTTAVWRIETGKTSPRVATLHALAAALKVSIDAITDQAAA